MTANRLNGVFLKGRVWALVIAATLCVPTAASAGYLSSDPSGAALDGYYGKVSFIRVVGSTSFRADLEFAVYPPGTFPLGTDPSNGNEYVYAYELFNLTSGTSTEAIKSLSVELNPASTESNISVTNVYLDPLVSGGTVPKLANFITSPSASAVWNYDSPTNRVPKGDHSQIVVFTSPFLPEMGTATIQGSLGSTLSAGGAYIPHPGLIVPEPGTTLLLAIGAIAGLLTCFIPRHK